MFSLPSMMTEHAREHGRIGMPKQQTVMTLYRLLLFHFFSFFSYSCDRSGFPPLLSLILERHEYSSLRRGVRSRYGKQIARKKCQAASRTPIWLASRRSLSYWTLRLPLSFRTQTEFLGTSNLARTPVAFASAYSGNTVKIFLNHCAPC